MTAAPGREPARHVVRASSDSRVEKKTREIARLERLHSLGRPFGSDQPFSGNSFDKFQSWPTIANEVLNTGPHSGPVPLDRQSLPSRNVRSLHARVRSVAPPVS